MQVWLLETGSVYHFRDAVVVVLSSKYSTGKKLKFQEVLWTR
jgi:hypothetical protein